MDYMYDYCFVLLSGTAKSSVAKKNKSYILRYDNHLLLYFLVITFTLNECFQINISLRKAGKLEHQGVKVEFIGQIELYYDRGNHHEFTSLVKELARPGELTHNTVYTFEFPNVEKPFESYTGSNVRLRYFLKVTIVRRLSDVIKELELVVHTLSSYPDMNNPIKMEVGIEDCLHIEFEYNKSK